MSQITQSVIFPSKGGNGDEDFYEIVNGLRVEKHPMGFFECGIATILAGYFLSFAKTNQTGRTRVETLFRLDSTGKLERRPDVAFVSFKRWPKNRKMPRTTAWAVVPDLAVEIISPSNLAEEITLKIQEYFQAGVQLVWVIYPVPGQVYVYESPTQVRILKKEDELDGGQVLPGFRLPVAALFEDELEENPA